MHGANVGFMEKWSWCGDDGRYDDLIDRSDLTLVACLEIPGEIFVEGGPPEAVGDGMSSGIESVMTKLVMRFTKDVNTICAEQDLLMSSALVSSP